MLGLGAFRTPFAFGQVPLGLAVFAVCYGLDWVATVPPPCVSRPITFGRSRVGVMFGWISAAHQLGAATAALGAGMLRTHLGAYEPSFLPAGLLCLLGVASSPGSRTRSAPRHTLPSSKKPEGRGRKLQADWAGAGRPSHEGGYPSSSIPPQDARPGEPWDRLPGPTPRGTPCQ